jgi:dGTPase
VPPPRLRHEMLRRVINAMVTDLIGESRKRLAKLDPGGPDAIRRSKQRVISFGAAMADANQAIKDFLFTRMYRHWRVNGMSTKARRLTEELYRLLHADPRCCRMTGVRGLGRAGCSVPRPSWGITWRG